LLPTSESGFKSARCYGGGSGHDFAGTPNPASASERTCTHSKQSEFWNAIELFRTRRQKDIAIAIEGPGLPVIRNITGSSAFARGLRRRSAFLCDLTVHPPLFGDFIAADLAVQETDYPVGVRGDVVFVSHEDDRISGIMELIEQIHDFRAGG